MQVAEIRKTFIEFFQKKKHTLVESSSLVPQNDPTLLFTNAGMVQFKDLFTAQEKRSYSRATSIQKCVRAGGKHNDLENVGFTARHHTFFEMLGNFSFGDYFKAEAIAYAWEFVTEVLQLPKDKLYVTVYTDDDEAAEIWEKQEKVPSKRISRFGKKDNFWAMGDIGPCGPCSEIFFDRGKEYGCKGKDCKVGCECDRYMEIWNLVFMQYNREKDGKEYTLKPLPKPSVDTGAGLERLASVLQKVDSNYETDEFSNIIKKISQISKQTYDLKKKTRASFRVIADHARATTFLINDGVLPSNEGRGYVLRRIIRRAIRHGSKLGLGKPFLNEVCLFVIDQMKSAYPDLEKQRAFIQKAVHSEEEQFFKTLDRGLSLLDEELKSSTVKKSKTLSGKVAFKLYDTYGFPLDLTQVICQEKNIQVDQKSFDQCMEKQKTESRKHWKGSGDESVSATYLQLAERLKAAKKLPKFVGYLKLEQKSSCLALLVDGKPQDSYAFRDSDSKKVEAVFLETPFYGESGGQAGDQGSVSGKNLQAIVSDVQKPTPQLTVVELKLKSGEIKVGETYQQTVHSKTRSLTARNHTATHLLHWALREVLGKHVKQAGSLVNADLLRFDFSHFHAMTPAEIEKVETLINEQVWENHPVEKEEMTKDAAQKKGAIAFFGEKYGDRVRVVSVGDQSVELCGGTHVERSGDIALFKVVSEQGIASGVRRIVAYTSRTAFQYLHQMDQTVKQLREKLRATNPQDVLPRIERMQNTEKELRKKIEQLEAQSAGAEVDTLIAKAQQVNGSQVLAVECQYDPSGIKRLRDLTDKIKQKLPNSISVLGMSHAQSQKVFVLAATGPEAPKNIKANELIQKMAPLIEGRGGGKPNLAQAGGSKPSGLKAAIEAAQKSIMDQIG